MYKMDSLERLRQIDLDKGVVGSCDVAQSQRQLEENYTGLSGNMMGGV
jgi:hypothetical protein